MADTARARGEPAPARGLCTFLKNAALLPACSFRLFALLSALSTASNAAIFLLVSLTSDDHPSLWLELADIARATFPSAVKIAVVSATVTSCSGERPTLASCLAKVMDGEVLGGSMVTAFLVSNWVMKPAFFVAVTAFLVLLSPLSLLAPPVPGSAQVLLLQLVVLISRRYLQVVCAVASVVAAAEPGRRGRSAVGRAWRLVRAKKTQAALCAAAAWALDSAARKPVVALGVMWSPTSAVGRIAYSTGICDLALNAVHVLTVVVFTAYYLECKTSEEDKAGHEHEE
jgi:membrane protein DedA with SNARE-associated domain